MSYELTFILGSMLVSVTIVALVVRKLIWSLIMLFYASIMFGLILITDGSAFAGLFHIVTFSGAISVLFMVIMMIVGNQASTQLEKPGKSSAVGIIITALAALPLILIVSNFTPLPNRISEQLQLSGIHNPPTDPLSFMWTMRSWDLILITILVAAAMLGIVNLFSRERGVEK
ncbi:MAG: NADH-quinone oxidoreductase subunit J [Candidatus Bathyarchaeia archaeon]